MPQKKSFDIFFFNFTQGLKSVILAIFLFCQDGTFQPVHEIQICSCPKDFFWGIMKVPYTKNILNFFQGQPNPGFRSVKVQTETFLKKDSRDFKKYFYLGFLRMPSKPGKQNWKMPFFWVLIIVKKQCVLHINIYNYIYNYLLTFQKEGGWFV